MTDIHDIINPYRDTLSDAAKKLTDHANPCVSHAAINLILAERALDSVLKSLKMDLNEYNTVT